MAGKQQKHRLFFPSHAIVSEAQEAHEIKQSKSNGCLKQGETSLLRKHISMEKMGSEAASRSRSSKTKAPLSALGSSKTKNKPSERTNESKVKISMHFLQCSGGKDIYIVSPLTPKKRSALSRNVGTTF
jgi:hypothetical protein